MHRSIVLACVAALSACEGQTSSGLPPEVLTLARIKVHMVQTLARQPNYTCVEQIERSRRRAPRAKYELVDMVRLEVALVDGKELFAWPGSSKFEDVDLRDLVPGGAIGNGNFALFARSVFETSAATFEHSGIVEWNGRPAIRYDYRVARMASGFRLRVNDREAIVGFHGSFWADPETLDVLRLDVIADHVPLELELQRSTTTMEYARVPIGERTFLLPSSSELLMVHLNGDESRNRVRFAGCRQYAGESVLTFGDAPADAAAVPAALEKESLGIPAGATFEVSLDDAIDGEKSMVGDPVSATLRQNIKEGKTLLFPKGSTLKGRIRRLEKHSDYYIVSLIFETVESTTHRSSTASMLEATIQPTVATRLELPTSHDGVTIRGGRLRLYTGMRMRLRSLGPTSDSSK